MISYFSLWVFYAIYFGHEKILIYFFKGHTFYQTFLFPSLIIEGGLMMWRLWVAYFLCLMIKFLSKTYHALLFVYWSNSIFEIKLYTVNEQKNKIKFLSSEFFWMRFMSFFLLILVMHKCCYYNFTCIVTIIHRYC